MSQPTGDFIYKPLDYQQGKKNISAHHVHDPWTLHPSHIKQVCESLYNRLERWLHIIYPHINSSLPIKPLRGYIYPPQPTYQITSKVKVWASITLLCLGLQASLYCVKNFFMFTTYNHTSFLCPLNGWWPNRTHAATSSQSMSGLKSHVYQSKINFDQWTLWILTSGQFNGQWLAFVHLSEWPGPTCDSMHMESGPVLSDRGSILLCSIQPAVLSDLLWSQLSCL